MSHHTVTIIAIAFATVGLSAWDVVPATNSVSGDTISEMLRAWSRSWLVIPYVWGLLAGHFFLGTTAVEHDAGTTISLWTVWVVFVVSLYAWQSGYEGNVYVQLALLAAGTAVGHVFWTQTHY
jgi:hypothetical protein